MFEIVFLVPIEDVNRAYFEAIHDLFQPLAALAPPDSDPNQLISLLYNTQTLYAEMVSKLIYPAYQAAILEKALKPIAAPRILPIKMVFDEPWQIQVTSCVRPDLNLGNYLNCIRGITEVNQILQVLVDSIKIDLPALLITQQIDQLMANLNFYAQQSNMTLKQYVQKQNKTVDQVRFEQKAIAENMLKLDLILTKIAEQQHIFLPEEENFNFDLSVLNLEEQQTYWQTRQQIKQHKHQQVIEFLLNV